MYHCSHRGAGYMQVNTQKAVTLSDTPSDAYRTPTILVVDDENLIVIMLEHYFRSLGITVLSANNGTEAVRQFEACPTLDLVFLDVCMPDMDGPQILEALQAINPQVKCCFMSGDLGRYNANELLGRGALCILRKPFFLSSLEEILHEHLSLPSIS